jgi:uncharacterized membrane protein
VLRSRPSQQVLEISACGPDDPDGSRAAAVLSAYFEAEHAQIFRRLLWRRLAVLGIVWVLVALTTSLLPHIALFVGVACLVATAVFAAIVEWRAGKRLSGLLADERSPR